MDAYYKQINRFDKAELEALLADRGGPCISLFLPISQSSGHAVQTDLLRLRNLVAQTAVQLAAQGLPAAQIEHLLAPVSTLAEPHREFWLAQHKELAIFIAPDCVLAYRLPLALPELVTIDRRFCLRPLLPLFDSDEHFYVLALSQNAVRLLQGTRDQVEEIELMDTPASLAEALRYDETERSPQLHASSDAGSGRHSATFSGQGMADDEKIVDANLIRFFQMVEREVTARLTRARVPLVLAGVEVDQALYRQVNRYSVLMDESIPGNPDKLTKDALYGPAWAIVAPYFQQARKRAIARYCRSAGQADGHTVTDIKNVVLAAVYHQVDTVFITPSNQIWGKYIPEGHQVVVHKTAEPGNEELINLAVVHTLRNHGAAYLVEPYEIPDGAALAAILRH